MGSFIAPRRSTLTAPMNPNRTRPPAGAFLYCQPTEGAAAGPGLPVEERGQPDSLPPRSRSDAA